MTLDQLLVDGDLPDGTHPVSSGTLRTYLDNARQGKLKDKNLMGFQYAHEAHSSGYSNNDPSTENYADNGVYIDDAVCADENGGNTLYVLKNSGNARIGLLIVGSYPPDPASYGTTQIKICYGGVFEYRYSSNGTWTNWYKIETRDNMESSITAQNKNSTTKYPNLKAVADYVDAAVSDISVPTKTSDLTNDSGFLTQHQSLSGCVPTNRTVAGLNLQSNIDADDLSQALANDLYYTLELEDYAFLQTDEAQTVSDLNNVGKGQYYYSTTRGRIGVKISSAAPSGTPQYIEAYTTGEIDAMIGDIETLLSQV